MLFYLLRFAVLLSLLASGATVFAAATQEALVNGQDYSVTNPGNQIVPLRIGAGADNSANASFKLAVIPCTVSAAAPTWIAGNMTPLSCTTAGAVRTTATLVGATTPTDAFANPTDGADVVGFSMGYNGATWDRLRVDAQKALSVNLADGNGAAAGAATDGMANPTAVGLQSWASIFNGTTWDRQREATGDALAATGLAASANMGWNGASWDRLQVDASKFLKVNIAAALPTGTNSIGAVVATGQENSNGSFTSINALTDASVRQVSAVASQNQIVLDLRNLNQIIAAVFSCSAGTAALTVESSVDNANWLTIDSVAAAGSGVKNYTGAIVGGTTAASPVAFRYVRITVATCGGGNTSTLTVAGK